MKQNETLVAVYFRRVRMQLMELPGRIRLQYRKIYLEPRSQPLELLKKMLAIQIVKKRLVVNWKIRLKNNENLQSVSLKELFERQSEFLQQALEEHQEEIKEQVMQNWHQRNNNKHEESNQNNPGYNSFL